MRRIMFLVLILTAAWAAWSPVAFAEESGVTREMVREELEAWQQRQQSDFHVYWKNGLKLDAWGGKVKLGFHGRIMFDATFFAGADEELEAAVAGEFHSGAQFRRAWTNVTGQITEYAAFMCQLAWETAPDPPALLDVWFEIRNLDKCLGCLMPDIRIGHYQEPAGLAWLTSSKYFTMTAWPLPTTTFTTGYNTGVMLHQSFYGDRATARLAFLGAASGIEGRHEWDDGSAVTGRLTFLPWAPCDCDCRVFHLGVGGSYRFGLQDTRFRSRPDLDFGPFVLDTGRFDAREELFLDVEAALVYDRFSVQGEYMLTQVDADAGTDPLYWGWYVQGSYFIGAPCRNYHKKSGTFAGPKPCENFDCTKSGELGAVELAVRYGYADIDDGDKQGGRASDWVFGVNWWLNPNARVMLNYVHSDVKNALGGREAVPGDGSVDAVVVRFQVHW